MKKIKTGLATILILLSLFTSPLFAQQLELSSPSKVQIDYEPFSGLPATSTLNLFVSSKFNNEDNELISGNSIQDRFRIRISPSQGSFTASNGQGSSLPIEFTSEQNNSRTQRIGNQFTEDISLNFDSSKRIALNYSAGLPESQFAKPGVYRLLLDIDVITITTNEVISNARVIEVEILVRPKLQTNIAGSNSKQRSKSKFATIDFGKLETNETGKVFLQVRGNTNAEILLSSENNGKLINSSHLNSPIQYTINFDGTASNLESPLHVMRPVAQTLLGSSYPLEVIIGEVGGAYSGQYRDIITIDVNPQ